MDRLRLGLLLLALAPVAWIVGVLAAGSADGLPGLALLLAGLGLAAWALPADRRMGAAGLGIAAAGILVFYNGNLVGGLANAAGGLFLLGCLAAGAGVFVRRSQVAALGFFVAALAGLLWVVADGTGGLEWQPGNLLALFGGALAGAASWKP
jgi:hypothetical protein